MTKYNDLALLTARILLAALFVVAGLGKLSDVQGFAGYMASGGVPAFLAWPVILFEIIAGLSVLAGFFSRPAALALAGFCLLSGLLYHFDVAQMNALLKNIALTGGYIALAVAGPGRFAINQK